MRTFIKPAVLGFWLVSSKYIRIACKLLCEMQLVTVPDTDLWNDAASQILVLSETSHSSQKH